MRYCLGIHYPDRLSNGELYARTKLMPTTLTLTRNRLRLVGHAMRRPELPLSIALHPQNQPTEVYRRGGALRRTYQAQLEDDLNAINLSLRDAYKVAQDRKEWQRLVKLIK